MIPLLSTLPTTNLICPTIYSDGTAPRELHYITPIANLKTIFEKGILSHHRAHRIEHADISNQEVQGRRHMTSVHNSDRNGLGKRALTVHRYANFYLTAHNAMMYVKRANAKNLCILRINPVILGRDEVIIADQNAATNGVTFHKASTFVFDPNRTQWIKSSIGYWSGCNDIEQTRRKQIRQAEVLVPYQVDPSFIMGIYTCSEQSSDQVLTALKEHTNSETPFIPVDLYPSLFYVGNNGNPPQLAAPPNHNQSFNRLYTELNEDLPSSDED
ncbi:MAG: DarT ssDNA thymidine ADP-ribosyltransferase family protein [Candidatus Rhabdochlamydia sp.]